MAPPPQVSSGLGEPIVLGAPIVHRPRRVGVLETDGTRAWTPPETPMLGALAVSADGATLVTADVVPRPGWSSHSEVGAFVWDASRGEVRRWLGAEYVGAVAISPGGTRIAAADVAGQVRLWSGDGGMPLHTIAFEPGAAVGLSPDGTWLIAAGGDGGVGWWDAATGQLLGRVHGHVTVRAAAISRAGHRVAIASDTEAHVYAFDGRAVTPVATLAVAGATELAFSPEGDALAIGDKDGVVHTFDLHAPKSPVVVPVAPAWPIRALVMLSATRFVASATRQLVVYDGARVGGMLSDGNFDALAVFADGRKLAAGDADGAVRIFDLTTGQEIRSGESHIEEVKHLALAPGGDVLSAGPWPGDGPAVRRWNVAARRSQGVARSALAIAGERIVSRPDIEAPELMVQDGGAAPRVAGKLALDGVAASAISPDGRWLAVGAEDGKAQVVDLRTGGSWSVQSPDLVQSLAISADGSLLATGGSKVQVWRAGQTARPIIELPGELLNTLYLGFTADGKRLVIASQSHGLQLWDLDRHAMVGTWFEGDGLRAQGTTDLITAGELVGDLLVTGHASGTVRVWELGTGSVRAQAARHGNVVTAIALAPDRKRLATADRDGVILVWPLDLGR